MTADFSKPILTDTVEDVFPQIRDNMAEIAKMFSGATTATNIIIGTVRFDSGKFQTWSGTAWVDIPIAITGGGTGANTAAGARTNIGAADDSLVMKKASNLSDVASASAARTNIGANNASNLDAGTVPEARLTSGTTSGKGIVQLSTSTSSTSTSLAATPSAVKTAYDRAGALTLISSSGAGWIKFDGGDAGTVMYVEFIDSNINGSSPVGGYACKLISSGSSGIMYSSILTARISSVNYEYRIKQYYDSVPSVKIEIEKLNLSTGAVTNIGINKLYSIGTPCTYLSDSLGSGV